MILKLQCAERMRYAFKCIRYRVCEVIHWIDTPIIASTVMMFVLNSVQNRVTHMHIGTLGWPLLAVLAGLPLLPDMYRIFRAPKPATRPVEYPAEIWPLWFSAHAFRHTRRFTSLFLLGLLADTALS